MRTLLRSLLAALFLCFAGAFLAPAAMAQSSCMEMGSDDAILHAGQLTTLLKVANFRADVKYMGDVALELEQFLGTCGDEATGRLAQVCDYDCHLQLGRYRLFLAAELPFLSSASGVSRDDSPLSPQQAQEIGRQGIDVIDRGLRILARQQAGGDTPDAQEGSYREFVRQLVTLSAVKIQLLMNTGDIWYQTVSEARVKQLDFMISDTLEAVSSAALESQPNLFKANTNYEAALWVLVETQMDIPSDSTYDDLRADLQLLQSDLTERTESVRKGFLFLNIDPMQFTTIPFEELKSELADAQHKLAEVEDRVETIVERWNATQSGEQTRALDEERTIRSQEVNLAAHKIGKLENEAQVFANDVQQQINALSPDRDTFAYRQQIRQMGIELATKLADFENQRRQINQRSELDLIVLNKEAESERRNELRWLISWELTKLNLDLQISSLESQITEYDRQVGRNASELEQLGKQRQIIATQIASSQTSIDQANSAIADIETRRTDIYAKSRAVSREEVCNIEGQLAFVGSPTSDPFTPVLPSEAPCQSVAPAFTRTQYVERMCGTDTDPGLREKLLNQQIQGRAFLLKCVVGDVDFSDLEPLVAGSTMVNTGLSLPDELAQVDCGSFTTTETDFAHQIYEAEKANYEARRADFEEQRSEVSNQLAEIIGWFSTFDFTLRSAQIILAAAETTYTTTSAIPKTTLAVAGMASGTYTDIDPAKAAKAAYDQAESVLSAIIQTGQVTQANINQITSLNQRLTQLKQATDQIDYDKALKAAALANTHFELAGKQAQGLEDIKELTLQSSIAAVDCDSQELGIDEQVARLNADHTRLLASMNLQASENDLLSFQIETQQRNIERYRNDIEIANVELDKIAINEARLNDDNAKVADLIASTRSRIDRVQQAESTVSTLSDESSQTTNVINELRDRQRDQMLALSNDELSYVEERVAGEKANTETLVDNLNQAVDLNLKNDELQASITQFQGSILKEVTDEQNQLTDLVSKIDDPNERRNLFIANQDTLAELLKGIPEYLLSKRRTLETANLLLHLMRQRFTVANTVMGTQTNIPTVYVRNATQLASLVDDIEARRFFNEDQINIDVSSIVVPANSGFARKLALTDSVDFEISPFAATPELMKQNGYFALWDPDKFRNRRNLTLIDTFIGTQYQCTGAQWNRYALVHNGSGMVFRPLTQGSTEVSADLEVGPPRVALRTFFNLATSQDTVNRIISYWLDDLYQVRNFPRRPGPVNDTAAALPYLGAPLIGSYRITLQPSTCPFDDAVFTLYFIFASQP